jgi:hypothetical protein
MGGDPGPTIRRGLREGGPGFATKKGLHGRGSRAHHQERIREGDSGLAIKKGLHGRGSRAQPSGEESEGAQGLPSRKDCMGGDPGPTIRRGLGEGALDLPPRKHCSWKGIQGPHEGYKMRPLRIWICKSISTIQRKSSILLENT